MATPKHSNVDVLIVGAGPAGMMSSMYLSEHGISHRVVDRRGTRTLNGRADGFMSRTCEIWDSFDILDKFNKVAASYGEWSLWSFDGDGQAGISRHQSDRNVAGLITGRLTPGLMNQGYTEAAFGDAIRSRGGPAVERGVKPISLEVDEGKIDDPEAYPITVSIEHSLLADVPAPRTGAHTKLEDGSLRAERGFIDCYGNDPHEIEQHVSGRQGTTETIFAKYVIGCDGAHSWVRSQLPDFKIEGDDTDAVFGVLDIIPLTDFPDIRKTCSILAHKGFCLVIPRENGLTRLYIQFPEDYDLKQKKDEQSIVADILNAAKSIFAPYEIDYKYCDWHTVYRVGQRVCNHASYRERVFLAGDAIHTHSPKGGQGMNISQHDAYNLAWKIAGVVKGQLPQKVLSTYEHERIPVARRLIAHDRDMAAVLTARQNRDEQEVQKVYARMHENNGKWLRYDHSSLVASDGDTARQSAASELKLGTTFPDVKVWSQARGDVAWSQSLLKSNGQWRLLVFAGDVTQATQLTTVNGLGDALAKLSDRCIPSSSRQTKWLDVLLFHSATTRDIEVNDFHGTYFPLDEATGRRYDIIYADYPSEGRDDSTAGAHEAYGVDPNKGALALVRPDQFIAWVGALEDLPALEEWLARFMLSERDPRSDSGQDKGKNDSKHT